MSLLPFLFVAMGAMRAVRALAVINQPSGFDCPGCAWPEAPPGARHRVEFCESGAKAVAEDATAARIDAAFFARHSLDDLRTRSDYWLGQAGRLTIPMIKRPGTTHYTPISWGDAFAEIARQLSGLADPNEAVFYTSGRTGNEAPTRRSASRVWIHSARPVAAAGTTPMSPAPISVRAAGRDPVAAV